MNFPNNEPLQNVELEGTWAIEDVYMNVAITKSNFPELIPIGKTFKASYLKLQTLL